MPEFYACREKLLRQSFLGGVCGVARWAFHSADRERLRRKLWSWRRWQIGPANGRDGLLGNAGDPRTGKILLSCPSTGPGYKIERPFSNSILASAPPLHFVWRANGHSHNHDRMSSAKDCARALPQERITVRGIENLDITKSVATQTPRRQRTRSRGWRLSAEKASERKSRGEISYARRISSS